MNDPDIGKKLSEPFPKQLQRTVKKGSANLAYIPAAEIIVRLNNVLGVEGWSSEILKVERDVLNPEWVVALVRLSATINGALVHKEAAGGQKIKTLKDSDEPVDLGDEFKGAVSDALKKAAQQLGVAIDLARKEEALRWEDAQDPPVVDLGPLKEKLAKLDEELKTALATWWKGEGLPALAELSQAQADSVVTRIEEWFTPPELPAAE